MDALKGEKKMNSNMMKAFKWVSDNVSNLVIGLGITDQYKAPGLLT